MKRSLLLTSLAVSFALVLAVAATKPRAASAEYPAAELSSGLLFYCLPDGTVRAELRWTTYGVGPQWVDMSLFNDDFQGDFLGMGPLPPGQSGAVWDGLTPGIWYVTRVNTLTPWGWAPSLPLAFTTPRDCLSPFAAAAYYPPPAPPECQGLSSGGCVWTGKADWQAYSLGESVVYCYSVAGPTYLRIVAFKPDGTIVEVANRFDPGNGACIGPYEAALPYGLRTVQMYGPGNVFLSETHFFVQ